MHKSKWSQVVYERTLSENFRATSLDSLANSSNQSESLTDEDSDSGSETKSKNSFTVKCEVYSQNPCGSIRSWTKSEGSNSERSFDNGQDERKRSDSALARMETIPEENEPKVSVKAILARFEGLKGDKDCNNNYGHNKVNRPVKEAGGSSASACSSSVSSKSSTSHSSNGRNGNVRSQDAVIKEEKKEKKAKKEDKGSKEVYLT